MEATQTNDAQLHNLNVTTTLPVRTCTGVTKTSADNVSSAKGKYFRLRVLIDGPYSHSGRMHSQLVQCSSVLCIAGGVSIAAYLPFLRICEKQNTKLFWSSRKVGLVADLTLAFNALPLNVKVETLVKQRFDLESIIEKDSVDRDGINAGNLGIVVAGPPGAADDVRLFVV